MKAVFQTVYGNSDVLRYGDQENPDIKPNQVLVRNYASSVNPRDCLIRSGRYQLQFLVPKFPLILGSDLAGEVLETGRRVKGFKPGDRVFGMKNPMEGLSTYAEQVAVPAANVALIPGHLSYIEAAGVPLCGLTAWQALVGHANLSAGKHVLVVGASGGVGSYSVQIAKALGATVTAVCSGANAEMVKALGADGVIDYQRSDFTGKKDRYDIIFDTVGRHNLKRYGPVLKPGGFFVSTIPSPENLKAMAVTRARSLLSKTALRAEVVMVKASGRELQRIGQLIEQGKVTPLIDRVFPLEETAAAHDLSRSLRAKGKIILDIPARS
ncbi:NADP-dependent oxidoreductase [Marinobacter arenosus]|uniref:NADP-dependent oxidoreductase n=1 Tax=Marinobacter arenosus TaxID=2856822 RepID=UPI001C4D981D|nr:NADP-dependent oxidoreductase [Marinobacter arenosus]MBW0145904.1 NADP-dependent oxidoreductase [Marinobacter arenosus]